MDFATFLDRALVLQKGQVVMQGDSGTLQGSSELAAYLGGLSDERKPLRDQASPSQ